MKKSKSENIQINLKGKYAISEKKNQEYEEKKIYFDNTPKKQLSSISQIKQISKGEILEPINISNEGSIIYGQDNFGNLQNILEQNPEIHAQQLANQSKQQNKQIQDRSSKYQNQELNKIIFDIDQKCILNKNVHKNLKIQLNDQNFYNQKDDLSSNVIDSKRSFFNNNKQADNSFLNPPTCDKQDQNSDILSSRKFSQNQEEILNRILINKKSNGDQKPDQQQVKYMSMANGKKNNIENNFSENEMGYKKLKSLKNKSLINQSNYQQSDLNQSQKSSITNTQTNVQTQGPDNLQYQDIKRELKNRRIGIFIHNFVENLKIQIGGKQMSLLQPGYIQTLNDLSFSSLRSCFMRINHKKDSLYKNKSKSKSTITKYKKKFERFPAFNPHRKIWILWGFFNMIASIPAVFMMPVEFISDGQFSMRKYNVWPLYLMVYILISLFDIFVQMNSAYYNKGRIVLNRVDILKRYLKFHFILDLCCLVSIVEQYSSSSFNFQFLIFLKIKVAFELIERITQIYICHKKIYNVMRLFHLFVLAMIICHIFACCFWYLATIQDQLNFSGQTWVEKVFQQSQAEMNWQRVYLYAFYFSCSTMSTVGYGDVTPSTNFEIWYSIFAMLFSSAVFGYILTYIGDIILDMNREKEVYKKEVHLTSKYLDKMGVDNALKQEVINYITFQFKNEGENEISQDDQNYILEKIPLQFKNKITLDFNLKKVNRIQMFNHFSLKTKEKIAMKLKQNQIQENTTIFEQNEQEENYELYFIEKGGMKIQYDKKSYKEIFEGQCLGEYSFLTGFKRENKIISTKRSLIYTINRNDFLEIVQQFPRDYQLYCLMRDKLIFKDNKRTTNIKSTINCQFCLQNDHSYQNCPLMHYIPDRTLIVLKCNYSLPHLSRNISYSRNCQRYKQCTLSLIITVNQAAEKYYKENQLLTSDQLYMSESEQPDQSEYFMSTQQEHENQHFPNQNVSIKAGIEYSNIIPSPYIKNNKQGKDQFNQNINNSPNRIQSGKIINNNNRKSNLQNDQNNPIIQRNNTNSIVTNQASVNFNTNNISQNANQLRPSPSFNPYQSMLSGSQMGQQMDSIGNYKLNYMDNYADFKQQEAANLQRIGQNINQVGIINRPHKKNHTFFDKERNQSLSYKRNTILHNKYMMNNEPQYKEIIQVYYNIVDDQQLENVIINDKPDNFEVYNPRHNFNNQIEEFKKKQSEDFGQRKDMYDYFGKYTYFNYKLAERRKKKKNKAHRNISNFILNKKSQINFTLKHV